MSREQGLLDGLQIHIVIQMEIVQILHHILVTIIHIEIDIEPTLR
jgi:hypothetical protein